MGEGPGLRDLAALKNANPSFSGIKEIGENDEEVAEIGVVAPLFWLALVGTACFPPVGVAGLSNC